MLRRNARLRKEYLYRKSLEGKEREEYEKKRRIRQALAGACMDVGLGLGGEGRGGRLRLRLGQALPTWPWGERVQACFAGMRV